MEPSCPSCPANWVLSASPGTFKTMTAEPLATRIRTLRLQQHIPQTTAAETAGVHVTTWRAWESGSKRPRLERGAAIAQALNVPVAACCSRTRWFWPRSGSATRRSRRCVVKAGKLAGKLLSGWRRGLNL